MAGIPEKEIRNLSESSIYSEDILKDTEYADTILNIEYIPFYRINGNYTLQGSLAHDEYKEEIEKAYTEWKKT